MMILTAYLHEADKEADRQIGEAVAAAVRGPSEEWEKLRRRFVEALNMGPADSGWSALVIEAEKACLSDMTLRKIAGLFGMSYLDKGWQDEVLRRIDGRRRVQALELCANLETGYRVAEHLREAGWKGSAAAVDQAVAEAQGLILAPRAGVQDAMGPYEAHPTCTCGHKMGAHWEGADRCGLCECQKFQARPFPGVVTSGPCPSCAEKQQSLEIAERRARAHEDLVNAAEEAASEFRQKLIDSMLDKPDPGNTLSDEQIVEFEEELREAKLQRDEAERERNEARAECEQKDQELIALRHEREGLQGECERLKAEVDAHDDAAVQSLREYEGLAAHARNLERDCEQLRSDLRNANQARDTAVRLKLAAQERSDAAQQELAALLPLPIRAVVGERVDVAAGPAEQVRGPLDAPAVHDEIHVPQGVRRAPAVPTRHPDHPGTGADLVQLLRIPQC